MKIWQEEQLLQLAVKPNTFIKEEYMWSREECVARNSAKTVVKLELAMRADQFSRRIFASLLSLISYALCTTQLNPTCFFYL